MAYGALSTSSVPAVTQQYEQGDSEEPILLYQYQLYQHTTVPAGRTHPAISLCQRFLVDGPLPLEEGCDAHLAEQGRKPIFSCRERNMSVRAHAAARSHCSG